MERLTLPRRRSCPLPAERRPRTIDHPVCARLYARQSVQAERLGLADRRVQLLEGLSGRVLELGAGNGLNFRHYPSAIEEVVAVEPERHLRGLAVEGASESAVPVTVVDALAEQLPYTDASFDAAVASLTLCSIAGVEQALAELHRVVRPGGELRFFEHVASPRRAARMLQRAADATIWPHLSGGCHLGRDTGPLIEAAGFEIVRCERFSFRIPPLDPPKTHIIGVARRAGTARRAPERA